MRLKAARLRQLGLIVLLTSTLSACTVNIGGEDKPGNTESVTVTTSSSNEHKGTGKIASEIRECKSFKKVVLATAGTVNIQVGSKQSVTVSTDENLLNKIKTEVDNDTLTISSEDNITFSKLQVEITVPKLHAVHLTGSGNLNFANLKGDDCEVDLAGSGNIKGSGNVDELDVVLSGSGNITLSELEAKDVDANLSGSGSIKVFSSKSLEGELTGSGVISYRGNPQKTDVKVTGSGRVMPIK